MPDNNLTEIVLVLDRSGSMGPRISDVIGGVAALIEEQRKKPGRATASIFAFDTGTPDTLCFGADIAAVEPLNPQRYYARGATALYDAIAYATDRVGARLAATPDGLRPGKVVVMVYTDGEENSSREFDADRIKSKMDHQREKYSWDYVFVGTNQDAVLSAQKIGIPQSAALFFSANNAGFKNAFVGMSNYVSESRKRAMADEVKAYASSFSLEDRANAVAGEDGK